MLSKIVQESVSSFEELFEKETWISKHLDVNDLATTREAGHTLTDFLISSQISLLKAELERKKGMLTELYYEDGILEPGQIEEYYQNKIIDKDITYLEEELTKLKALRRNYQGGVVI